MKEFHQDEENRKVNTKEKLEKIGINVELESGQIDYNGNDKLSLKCEALYLLRHAHTKATQEHKFMSDFSENSHICQKGIDDILKLENCCERYNFNSVIVCSNIPRVLETAIIFKEVNPNIEFFYQNDFKGINNEGWENKEVNMFNEQEMLDYTQREIKHNIFAKSTYGESWNQVLLNCINLINYINEEHSNERILLIGQGSIIRGINILIGTFEKPWDQYNVKRLYNFEEKNKEDNYGTISCIMERGKGIGE